MLTQPSVRSSFIWAAIGRFGNLFLVVIATFVLARSLPKADFAASVLTITFITLFGQLISFGLPATCLRLLSQNQLNETDRSHEHKLRVCTNLLFVFSTLGLCLHLCIAFVLNELHFINLTLTQIALVGICSITRAWNSYVSELLRFWRREPLANLFGGVNGGVIQQLIFVLLVAIQGLFDLNNYGSVLTAAVVSNACSLLAIAPFLGIALAKSAPKSTAVNDTLERLAIVKSASAVIATSFLNLFMEHGDLFLAGAVLPPNDLANYSLARRIASLIRLPTMVSHMATVSRIAPLHSGNRHDELQGLSYVASTASALLAVSCAVSLYLFREQAVLYLGGVGYSPAATLMGPLCIGFVIMSTYGLSSTLLTMTGHEQQGFRTAAISVALAVFVWAIGSNSFGTVGLVYAYSISLGLRSLLLWKNCYELIGIDSGPNFVYAFRKVTGR